MRLSNCGKSYLMIFFLLQKQKPISIITKSLNQYSFIKAQSSDEIQPLEKYENCTVVFEDMLPSKSKAILICFLQEDVIILLIKTTYFNAIFISQKILAVKLLIQIFYLNKL